MRGEKVWESWFVKVKKVGVRFDFGLALGQWEKGEKLGHLRVDKREKDS